MCAFLAVPFGIFMFKRKKQSRQSLIHQASQRAGFSLSNFICFSCLWLNFLSHEGKGCSGGLLFGLFFAFSHANRHGIGI